MKENCVNNGNLLFPTLPAFWCRRYVMHCYGKRICAKCEVLSESGVTQLPPQTWNAYSCSNSNKLLTRHLVVLFHACPLFGDVTYTFKCENLFILWALQAFHKRAKSCIISLRTSYMKTQKVSVSLFMCGLLPPPLCSLAELMNNFKHPKTASLSELADGWRDFSKLFIGWVFQLTVEVMIISLSFCWSSVGFHHLLART